jgi:hydroxymethylpyrimidine pyrophosphatase-like HAD family hydrolase
MAELQALIGGAQFSLSAKLSKGGQICLTAARAELVHRLQAALDGYLRESERDDWRVRSGEYYLDILPPSVSKRAGVGVLASEAGLDRSAVLCIGRFGCEGGGITTCCGMISA